MKPIVLFRSDNSDEVNAEREAARKHFEVVPLRSDVPADALVIARYSALPYYRELEQDLAKVGSRLVNSFREHCWIADFEYYEDLREFTPRSWLEHEFYASGYDGPLVIKGRTNSRKHQWNKKMFAPNRRAAIDVASELANDPLIGPQGLVYREYIPLVTFETCSISGLPFTNEWRLFYYEGALLAAGYYWSTASDESKAMATLPPAALIFARQVAEIAAQRAKGFVLDIAEKQSGGWMLVEVNDLQMAGLSEVNADELYRNLAAAMR